MSSERLIDIEDLHRSYRIGPTTVHAVHGISLSVDRGQRVAVVGVSGSGKSTLLHLLGGLDTPSSGRIAVDGRDLASLDARGRTLYRRTVVGFVFQSFHLVPSFSAIENVSLALTFQGVTGPERRRRAQQALMRVGLDDRAEHRPGQLSGGEQQRVAIARAIVHEPTLLLADEPTGNLDRKTAREVWGLLRAIGDELGTTIVMVTHDEEAARCETDRIVRLCDGRILEPGDDACGAR